MKIYTKTGDNGETGLCDGKRVKKTDPRVQACGDIDELSCVLGEFLVMDENEFLVQVQKDLFNIGSILAKAKVDADFEVLRIEEKIDEIENQLPTLTDFVLPGGNSKSAKLHTARAVCRRAERAVCAIDSPNKEILQYLNRLSDLLFVLARYTNINT
jgi:cob(I)alamin adenosyltransferase